MHSNRITRTDLSFWSKGLEVVKFEQGDLLNIPIEFKPQKTDDERRKEGEAKKKDDLAIIRESHPNY